MGHRAELGEVQEHVRGGCDSAPSCLMKALSGNSKDTCIGKMTGKRVLNLATVATRHFLVRSMTILTGQSKWQQYVVGVGVGVGVDQTESGRDDCQQSTWTL